MRTIGRGVGVGVRVGVADGSGVILTGLGGTGLVGIAVLWLKGILADAVHAMEMTLIIDQTHITSLFMGANITQAWCCVNADLCMSHVFINPLTKRLMHVKLTLFQHGDALQRGRLLM